MLSLDNEPLDQIGQHQEVFRQLVYVWSWLCFYRFCWYFPHQFSQTYASFQIFQYEMISATFRFLVWLLYHGDREARHCLHKYPAFARRLVNTSDVLGKAYDITQSAYLLNQPRTSWCCILLSYLDNSLAFFFPCSFW